jgi:hypothetical protein
LARRQRYHQLHRQQRHRDAQHRRQSVRRQRPGRQDLRAARAALPARYLLPGNSVA